MGAEEGEAQPRKNNNGRTAETLQTWANEPRVYESALITCIFEYAVILLFGISLIVEYYRNVYQQQYFGSFNPIFLVIVLMASSGYGFARLVNLVGGRLGKDKSPSKTEDDY